MRETVPGIVERSSSARQASAFVEIYLYEDDGKVHIVGFLGKLAWPRGLTRHRGIRRSNVPRAAPDCEKETLNRDGEQAVTHPLSLVTDHIVCKMNLRCILRAVSSYHPVVLPERPCTGRALALRAAVQSAPTRILLAGR